MNNPAYPAPVLEARDASEAVGVFLKHYCGFFVPSRDSQIIDTIKLFVRVLIERREEVALEFELRPNIIGRNEDEDVETYNLRTPQPIVKLLEAMFHDAEVGISNQATRLTSKFGNRIVLRASIDSVLFGGRVIWQCTNFADSVNS